MHSQFSGSDGGLFPCSGVKHVIEQARLVWTFSEGHLLMGSTPDMDNLGAAKTGIDFLNAHFRDEVFGGYFWSSNESGIVFDDRKYLHAQLMVLTALSKFVSASGDSSVRKDAFRLLDTIKGRARDNVTGRGGWLEHFTREWRLITMGAGPIGAHGTKTINTFIIFVDALTELHKCCATFDARVSSLLLEVLRTEAPRFITPDLLNSRAEIALNGKVTVSGTDDIAHLIEAVWLIIDANSTLGEPLDWGLFDKYMAHANENIDPGTGGITSRGGIPWWAQAEYLASFSLRKSLRRNVKNSLGLVRLLDLIVCNFVDISDGIWIEAVDGDGKVVDGRKQHRWKAGFHAVRGMRNFASAFFSSEE